MKDSKPAPLWSRGMIAVLAAQFVSALADNALLFVAIALLKSTRYPDWSAPLLQEFFVAAFIILAPFVGPFADSMPKGRVMLLSTGMKLTGALGMAFGSNPFLAYALVGIGAAAYSPARFGILTELTSAEHLVTANGFAESLTFTAMLAGALTGGVLADWSVPGALRAVAGCYAVAAIATLFIPRLEPAHKLERVSLPAIVRDFARTVRNLSGAADARFCLVGTSLFSGAGATMRFLLVAWVPVAFGTANISMPAYLNAIVVVGIVAGALLAARFVTLEKADRVLPAGILIGIAVVLLSGATELSTAFAIMALVGACAGFYLVPLNALLQARGQQTVGAGHAIAVQNLIENSTTLLMLGLYTTIVRAGVPVGAVAAGFGACFAVAITGLWIHRSRERRTAERSNYP